MIGNLMDFFAEDDFDHVSVAVSNDPSNIGKLIFAQIMLLQEDGSYLFIDRSEDHKITASENGDFIGPML
jgi:hypothetical protein